MNNSLKQQEIIVIIDETGDRKKGGKTDYVQRQYIGNLAETLNLVIKLYIQERTKPINAIY
jgi:SRSO17 transposase